MKPFIYSILFFYFFASCNYKDNNQSIDIIKEIKIPSITKNKNDVNFSLKNGILFYENKVYSGVINDFYDNGNIKSTSQYFEGKREGKYFGWYLNKNKSFQRFYKNGIKTGTHLGWFKDGSKMFEYQLNNKGVYHGYVKDWHQNGQIAKHFNFIDGKENGSQKMWQLNGKIRANFYTINNERHGLIGLKNCVSVINEVDN
ncbi:hypothetical protein [Polaribacter sp. Z022]|uniref:toxin-antitoxin system YwqK family antitoxin n=1 Tax=Polaribacter sp. Z022 TaxID=2927125 RepID=UPI00202153AF|nr:hypothetical protein [Polaribacter sp. Z022]MCL7753464.1 hypothetical protein [Polaribacter sp. Z022]